MTDSQGVRKSSIDWMLVAIVAVLVVLGLIMQYSASSYNLSLVKRQAYFAAGGFAAMFVIWRLPAKFVYYVSIPLYLLALLITAATRFIGEEVNGARRWIKLVEGVKFQPSELLKAVMIMALAMLISKYINEINNLPETRLRDLPARIREMGIINYIISLKGYILMLLCTALAAADVVLATKDLGTGIIVFGIGFLVMLVVSPRCAYLVVIAAAALVAIAVLIFGFSYRTDRITAFTNLEGTTSNLGYQIKQGLYAIGSGGWFGKGLGRSVQKEVVPEPQTDMIFSIVCEELGIIGGMIIILLFIIMILRLKKIYDQISDLYGKILVFGVTSHIGLQTLVNLAVITNLSPNTGVPLPFISYGGTSLLCLMAEMGLVLCAVRTEYKLQKTAVFENVYI